VFLLEYLESVDFTESRFEGPQPVQVIGFLGVVAAVDEAFSDMEVAFFCDPIGPKNLRVCCLYITVVDVTDIAIF